MNAGSVYAVYVGGQGPGLKPNLSWNQDGEITLPRPDGEPIQLEEPKLDELLQFLLFESHEYPVIVDGKDRVLFAQLDEEEGLKYLHLYVFPDEWGAEMLFGIKVVWSDVVSALQ